MPGPHGFAVREPFSPRGFGVCARRTKRCRKQKHRRSSARVVRSRAKSPPCDQFCAPGAAASTASRPNVRDDGQRPSLGTGCPIFKADLGVSRSGFFLQTGLDRFSRAKVFLPVGQITNAQNTARRGGKTARSEISTYRMTARVPENKPAGRDRKFRCRSRGDVSPRLRLRAALVHMQSPHRLFLCFS
jgi:hypothetical protein